VEDSFFDKLVNVSLLREKEKEDSTAKQKLKVGALISVARKRKGCSLSPASFCDDSRRIKKDSSSKFGRSDSSSPASPFSTPSTSATPDQQGNCAQIERVSKSVSYFDTTPPAEVSVSDAGSPLTHSTTCESSNWFTAYTDD